MDGLQTFFLFRGIKYFQRSVQVAGGHRQAGQSGQARRLWQAYVSRLWQAQQAYTTMWCGISLYYRP